MDGLPDRRLSPNARSHWRARASAAGDARELGEALGLRATAGMETPVFDGPVRVVLTFRWKDKRRRDVDGLISRMKPVLDGMQGTVLADDDHIVEIVGRKMPHAGETVTVIEVSPY